MVKPARRLDLLRADGERKARGEHEQRDHDRDEQTHGRSLFGENGLSPSSTQSLLGESRPALRVLLGYDDPLLHRPAPLAGIEQVGAVERERLGVPRLVGQLEDHLALPEADPELPAALERRHPHHLRELDVGIPGKDVVDDLVEALPCVHGRRV